MKRIYLCFVLIIVFCIGCSVGEKNLDKNEVMENTISEVRRISDEEKVNLFRCINCEELASVCECHTEYGYPENYCCKCARVNYTICDLCHEAKFFETVHTMIFEELNGKKLNICEECLNAYTKENPVYIEGKEYYFSTIE